MAIHTKEQLAVRIASQERQQGLAQRRLEASHRAGKHAGSPAVKCDRCRVAR